MNKEYIALNVFTILCYYHYASHAMFSRNHLDHGSHSYILYHRERKCADTISTVLAISNAKILMYFQIKYTKAQHPETVMVQKYRNADYSLNKNKFIVSFIIIFGTLSFPISYSSYSRCQYYKMLRQLCALKIRIGFCYPRSLLADKKPGSHTSGKGRI